MVLKASKLQVQEQTENSNISKSTITTTHLPEVSTKKSINDNKVLTLLQKLAKETASTVKVLYHLSRKIPKKIVISYSTSLTNQNHRPCKQPLQQVVDHSHFVVTVKIKMASITCNIK